MTEKLQEALINFIAVLCGGFIASFSSILLAIYSDYRDRQRRREDRIRERKEHNIIKIEVYLDSRISMIKSLTNPPVTITTVLEHLKPELWKHAGASEEARASAMFLGDTELARKLGELESIFLQVWHNQITAKTPKTLPIQENEAIQVYHHCIMRVELLKRKS